jgi:hypothetical protein
MGEKRGWILLAILIIVIMEIVLFVFELTELAYYNTLLLLILIIIFLIRKIFQLPNVFVFGLVIVGLLNLLGGLVFVDGIRLYDVYFGIIKLDMIIHAFGAFVGTLTLYYVLERGFKKASWRVLLLLTGLCVMGIGALFEVLELAGLVFLGNQGVGDYFNNAIDLLTNLIGILAGSVLIIFRRE